MNIARTVVPMQLQLFGLESESLEKLIDRPDVQYCVPIPAPGPVTRGWCGDLIVSVHFPTRGWVNAEVFSDEGGALYADLLREHRCEPMERWARRLETPDNTWEGDVE